MQSYKGGGRRAEALGEAPWGGWGSEADCESRSSLHWAGPSPCPGSQANRIA